MRRWAALLTALTMLVCGAAVLYAAAEPELLPAERAFRVSARLEGNVLHVDWAIADGYYLLKDRLAVEGLAGRLGAPRLPTGELKNDALLGKVEIYRREVTAQVPVSGAMASGGEWPIRVTSQGCADIGVCYPPHTQTVSVPVASSPGFVKAGTQGSQTAIEALRELSRSVVGVGDDEFLPPEMAYILSVRVVGPDTVVIRWDIAKGYYLYRDKLHTTVIEPTSAAVSGVDMPPGLVRQDEYFGRVNVFYDVVEYRLDISRETTQATELVLDIAYQGCADAGLCYPPLKHQVSLELPARDAASAISPAGVGNDSQQACAATVQWHALSGFRSVGLRDVVLATPARPSVAKASHRAPLNRLVTNPDEKCGRARPWLVHACLSLDFAQPMPTAMVCAPVRRPDTPVRRHHPGSLMQYAGEAGAT